MDPKENAGTTETNDSNIDIRAMSEVDDADLEAFLTAEADAEAQGEYAGDTPEPEPTKEVAQIPPPAAEDQIDPNAPVTRKEMDALLKRLQGQEKRVDGQELLIKRRTSELGQIKKQLLDVSDNLKRQYQEMVDTDPERALDIRDEYKETQKKLEQVNEAEQTLERRGMTQQFVETHVPQEQFDVEAMAETLSGDGIAPEYIESFKRDPIGFLDGDYNPGLTLIQVAKRAYAESLVKKLFPVAQQLAARVKELEGNQGDVLKKVQQVAKQTPTITASGARPSKSNRATTLDESMISKMTDAELEEFLSEQK